MTFIVTQWPTALGTSFIIHVVLSWTESAWHIQLHKYMQLQEQIDTVTQ